MSKKRPDKQVPVQQGRTASTTQQAQATKQGAEKPKPLKAPNRSGMPWHPFWRLLTSLFLLVHLLAVFVAPWAITTRAALPPDYQATPDQPEPTDPNSPPLQKPIVPWTLHRYLTPYQNLLYINHGYNFFAPDPAGTHLIRYQVPQISGEPLSREFPNLQQQWPRLLYHRHMMLAEQTWGMGSESGQHYANHLSKLYGVPIKIDLYYHTLLDPQSVIDGRDLTEASTYVWRASVGGRVEAEEINQPSSAESIVIPGAGQ